MIKNIKSVGVLVAICSIIALLLALTNQITAPIIKHNEELKAAEALQEVLPTGELFEEMNLDEYQGKLPDTVTKVYKETAGAGYVIELTTKGFNPDMVIMCGVTPDGVVQGAKCTKSGETLGYEETYGDNFKNKDAAAVDAVDIIGGATKTTGAYKAAIKDAINTVLILGGAEVDLRSEEEKAVDKMKEDLGATEKVDLSKYSLPASVTEILKGDKGYVIYLTAKGWQPGMEIVCGVGTDNKIVNAVCLKSNETNGAEKDYGQNFIGKDAAGVDAVDTIGGASAPLTKAGYKQAMKDALTAVQVLGGANVDLRTEEEKAVDQMKADLEATEEADLSQYKLPSTVTKAYIGSKGYVIYLTAKGWQPGMEIVCGVGTDNKIVNAVCLKSNETNGAEKDYGQNFIGKDAAGVDAVDTIGGASAPLTKAGYKQAVKEALNVARVLAGEDIDLRDPATVLADNLNNALPAGEGKFTKQFLTEAGAKALYTADNGKGYVVVIGDAFVGVDAEGNSDNATAAAIVNAYKNSTLTDVDLTAHKGLADTITAIKKTSTGNYVIDIDGLGYAYYDDNHGYGEQRFIPIKIRVSMTAKGTIINCLTVSHEESKGFGDVCGTEAYYSQFDGTTNKTYTEVDGIAGATWTTDGYMNAIKHCFEAVAILEGGAA